MTEPPWPICVKAQENSDYLAENVLRLDFLVVTGELWVGFTTSPNWVYGMKSKV